MGAKHSSSLRLHGVNYKKDLMFLWHQEMQKLGCSTKQTWSLLICLYLFKNLRTSVRYVNIKHSQCYMHVGLGENKNAFGKVVELRQGSLVSHHSELSSLADFTGIALRWAFCVLKTCTARKTGVLSVPCPCGKVTVLGFL